MGSRVQNSSDEKEEKYVEGILPPLGLKKSTKMENQTLTYTCRKRIKKPYKFAAGYISVVT